MKLLIENTSPVPTDELGAILTSIGKAFESYSRTRASRKLKPKMAVKALETGSLEIVFDLLDNAKQIYEARELFGPFATHLAEGVSALLGIPPRKVAAPDRKVLEAFSRPIAEGHATQINIVNNGEINLHIDEGNAAKILDALSEQRRSTRRPVANLLDTPEQRAVEAEGVEGTALFVEGQWYGRLLHGQGVLVPLYGDSNVISQLEHNALYLLRGSVLRGTYGEAVGIRIERAARLDRSG